MYLNWSFLISYFLTYSYCHDSDENENIETWVKPYSLFGDSTADLNKTHSPLDSNDILQKNLNDCQFDLKECISAHNPARSELLFFKRFISSIKRLFPILESETNDIYGHYSCDIDLSPSNYKYLTEFTELSSSTEKIAILENIFTNIRWVENDHSKHFFISEHNFEALKIVVMILISALLFIKVMQTFYFMDLSFYRILLISLILMFVISIPWTWWHLYQKARSKKMAEIHKGIPDSCKAENLSFWYYFKNLFTIHQEECSKYFENIEVNPFLEVTPTMALSVTITRFILEPAEYIGDAFRRFIMATFYNLPFYLYVPVIIFMIIIFITVMFTINGYRLKTLLFSIEPSSHIEKELLFENIQLKKKIEALEMGAGDNIIPIKLCKKDLEIGAGDNGMNVIVNSRPIIADEEKP